MSYKLFRSFPRALRKFHTMFLGTCMIVGLLFLLFQNKGGESIQSVKVKNGYSNERLFFEHLKIGDTYHKIGDSGNDAMDIQLKEQVVIAKDGNHEHLNYSSWNSHNISDEHQKGISNLQSRDGLRNASGANEKKRMDFPGSGYDFDMINILHQYRQKGYAIQKPINIFNYGYRINPESMCYGQDFIKILFVVKTSTEHIERRNTIRITWGDRERFHNIRVVFSLGIPTKYKLENLYNESRIHNDILLVDFVDTYYNLTLKSICGMRWAANHCARAAFVVSVDDDVYIATDLLIKYLDKLPPQQTHKLFAGYRYSNTKPYRKVGHRWAVSDAEYPYETYPHYVFGGCVIMSIATAQEFSIAAMYTKMFKFEDVYLGMLASRLGINVTMTGNIIAGGKITSADKAFKTVIASHYYGNPTELRNNWNCHLTFLANYRTNIIFCEYIRKLFKEIQVNFDEINSWTEK